MTQQRMSLEGFEEKVKEELLLLQATLNLLRKATGLDADGAMAFVACQRYLQDKIQMIYMAENARLQASQTAKLEKEKQSVETVKPEHTD